ncbi:MAG: RNA polymerase sigma factor [Planctomycetota bacterium]|jgi:RNA polymerase sigma-70 factor (ECF subfamily)
MLSTVTSTVLLEGLREQGNDAAWRQFCTRYEPALLAFVRRAGFREQDANDVVQETLAAFFQSYRDGRYDRAQGRLRSWLKGIALNKIREARRRIGGPEVQLVDQADATAFINRIPDDRELKDAFEQEWERQVAAECLREVSRQVDAQTFRAFKLYAVDNWPPDKVATHLGMSRNAVYVSKSRVLSRLRALQADMTQIW